MKLAVVKQQAADRGGDDMEVRKVHPRGYALIAICYFVKFAWLFA